MKKYKNYTPNFPEFYVIWDIKFTPEEIEKIINNPMENKHLIEKISKENITLLNDVKMEYKLDSMPLEKRKQYLRFWDRMWDWDWSLLEKWKHKIT